MNPQDDSTSAMRRVIWPLLWAFFFLSAIEVALEYRAVSRGFRTHLFGQNANSISAVDGQESNADENFGPAPGFPFRSRIVAPQKKQDTIRIWVASSSHAEDIRMEASDVFPSILETELNRCGINCEVLNASRAGMTLENNCRDLDSLASKWNPDIVIAYQMCNDLKADFYSGDDDNRHESESRSKGLPKLTGVIDRFIERTTLYELLKTNVSARIDQAKILRSDVDQSSESLYFQRLEQLEAAAAKANAKFYVCTFGFVHFDSEMPDDYELFLLRTLSDLKPSAWRNVVHRWNQSIRERYPEVAIDVAASIASKSGLFRDPVHFTKRGHELVGKTIAREIANRSGILQLGRASVR